MKVYLFDLLPYDRHFDEFKADRFMPWPLPGRYFDPAVAARSYAEHLAVWEEMDRLGYDGVGLNEHHTTPHGLMNSPNLMAAAASQRTKRLKFFILGNLLPLHNPLRIAEELAMVDCLSGGRLMARFARGVPREYKVYDVPLAAAAPPAGVASTRSTTCPWRSRARASTKRSTSSSRRGNRMCSRTRAASGRTRTSPSGRARSSGRTRPSGSRSPAARKRSSGRRRAISAPPSTTPIAT